MSKKGVKIEATVEICNLFDSLDSFCKEYPNARIHAVNGKIYLGKCVNCNSYVFEHNYVDLTDEVGCTHCFDKNINILLSVNDTEKK